MRLHVVLPNESIGIDPQRIIGLAGVAERLGYDAVWLPDHLLPPAPYGRTYGGVYEPLITLAAIAATTTSIRLGTSILILPLRDPFLLAKQVSTLDRISGGRMTLGVGIGWDRAEFANVGVDFATRAARADEALELMRRLWSARSNDVLAIDGERYGFDNGVFAPAPYASGTVRLMVGGTSGAALRRVARFADVWQAVGIDADEFVRRHAELRTAAGRDVEAGVRMEWTGEGELSDALAEARGWASVGADHLAIWFGEVDGFADRMARFKTALRTT